jgi:hypothetical protein
MSVKSASRHRELTASSATQFRSRFSSAKSDAYKVHALVRILLRGIISQCVRIRDIPKVTEMMSLPSTQNTSL